MKKFVVGIEEMVYQEFYVLANSEEEALEMTRRSYKKGEFVLEPGELVSKKMAIIDDSNEEIVWEDI